MKNLKISKEISLPADVVTQTIAILAKRRAGKSYTMRRIAEQLLAAGQQLVIVDPKGDQWGIRSSADGKSAGYSIVILGGEHADVPLEVNAGEVVAKLVVEERVSILLDLSMFRKHEIATFMAIFLENLYRLKAQEKYRTPVMLVVDEADAVAPQKPQKGEERMLGAIEDIVRRGGQRGIGCLLVTQRSAVLNKNVLTQAQMLVVLRTIAPQDIAAMKAWIDVHGTLEQGKELIDSLPSLPIGDAWFWSPGWPTDQGIFQRSHVLPIETFDSGATPKPGERKIIPKTAADVDLEALKRQMSDTIEKAKADDPKTLKKKILELETMNTNLLKNTFQKDPVAMGVSQWMSYGKKYGYDMFFENKLRSTVRQEILAETEQEKKALNKAISEYRSVFESISKILNKIDLKVIEIKPPLVIHNTLSDLPKERLRDFEPGQIIRLEPNTFSVVESGNMGAGERSILTAVAQIGEKGITRPHITALTSYKKSTRDRYLQYLQQKEYVRLENGRVFPTAAGIAALGPGFEPLPTGVALQEHLMRTLPEGERKIMKALFAAYPDGIERDELTSQTGYQKSTRDRYLQYLAAKELVDTSSKGVVVASGTLFEE